ncbi:restriction endonuclease, partial [Salmonella enterica]|nr:restriction endonuclease [Salmonella enterica]EDF9496049.1 restriction endonuclease [Salmonella enterica]EDL0338122.1 restriction endonuclease [Salmonella enterica subsp. enterica serovar Typhimurium]
DIINKQNLSQLIQKSKKDDSENWEGKDWIIKNTPQQGINWIGEHPNIKAVIIKTKDGSYADDGWKNNEKTIYSYSFKAAKGIINFNDSANRVLINQPISNYPILLFTDSSNKWEFQGCFKIIDILEKAVILEKMISFPSLNDKNSDNDDVILYKNEHTEGKIKYITHMLSERNRKIIDEIKDNSQWVCDICEIKFLDKYGKNYIEAHHKIPIHTFTDEHRILKTDFALLCPNCHKAVHIYLREENLQYEEAKIKIRNILKR